ncbi:MAG TPA: hypothetical protein EYG03_25325 [Planctomycetes bacterium]|nr:hypothetical protein [Fuerstiella sp.]HIK95279.1 hypothetical protein [Planctomycetota bacterium]
MTTRTGRRFIVPAIALTFGVVCMTAAQAQQRSGRGFSRSSLLGLLSLEQVQKEMKLSEEQMTEVQEIVKNLGTEMREQFSTLRSIEDRDQQRTKIIELLDQSDQKVREQLGDVVERPQLTRLYQIRLQVRAVADSLANSYVSGKLKITDDQKKKLDELNKSAQAEQLELFTSFRGASEEQRSTAFQKLRDIRSKADAAALVVLNAEQKTAFEEMKGEKIELQSQRGR